MDRDSFGWFFWLLVIGSVFIALFTLFRAAPYIILLFASIFVSAALWFIYDYECGRSYKLIHKSLLVVWSINILFSAFSFAHFGDFQAPVINIINPLVYFLSWVSAILFARMMFHISQSANLETMAKKWKLLTIQTAFFYSIPIIVFFSVFVARALKYSAEIELWTDSGFVLSSSHFEYLIRIVNLIPLIIILINIYQTREAAFQGVAP
jgi:hypothetical protein